MSFGQLNEQIHFRHNERQNNHTERETLQRPLKVPERWIGKSNLGNAPTGFIPVNCNRAEAEVIAQENKG